MSAPDEPPPSYQAATASSSTARPATQHLSPNQIRNGIPPDVRRSMEDEGRPLPSGWLRQYDHAQHHQFFVDTNKDPPKTIWHHPYDDEEYLNSLGSAERKKVQGLHKVPSDADVVAMSSDEDGDHHPSTHHGQPSRPIGNTTQQQPSSSSPSFGRKLKDKLTNTTHEQREAQRRQRAIEEQQAYEHHQHIRQCMSRAIETGQPQLLGKDRDGKDLYIEPPQGPGMQGQAGYPGVQGRGGYGYNPYQQGVYSTPNARYIRPQNAYGRPYGGGYGGGYGLPLMGGMMGGLLMGDMMFGGMGGGFGGGGL